LINFLKKRNMNKKDISNIVMEEVSRLRNIVTEEVNEYLGNGVGDLSQKEVRDLKTKINNASTIGKFFTSEEKEFLMSLIEPAVNEEVTDYRSRDRYAVDSEEEQEWMSRMVKYLISINKRQYETDPEDITDFVTKDIEYQKDKEKSKEITAYLTWRLVDGESVNEAAAPKFTAKEFVAYVNDEFDIETIELMQSVLAERMKFLDKMKDIANPRNVVQGYMRKDDLKESLGRYALKLDEGAFSDLDILADESSDFNEFLGKVQQEFPQVKTNDPTFKDFLKKLFDTQDTMAEITQNPMDSGVFDTICEVAEINGFNKKITKKFKTSTALVLHISKQLSNENRQNFMEDVREIKNAFSVEEFIL
tara:strand:- start:509 stop:1597 length:1089 start_codon:yes stop_codon:yes gene_type:complete